MYLYEIGSEPPRAIQPKAMKPGGAHAAITTTEEARPLLSRFGLPERLMDHALQNRAMAYESHEGFDFACVNLLNADFPAASPMGKVCIYFTGSLLLFACAQPQPVADLLSDALSGEVTPLSPERLLLLFLERLNAGGTEALEDLEQEITDLEDALITERKRSAVREIISLRQRLMTYKRHYEQLLSVLDMLEENDDELLSAAGMRTLKIISSRADRLYHAVLNLRDYVTQVRESYQAQVDISLNNIMKIFTVITAIFLPLTLIVGWYGMNLQMPEYGWRYGYLAVIALSVAVVIACMVFFKRRKWF